MVALLCVAAGPCLRHPAYPTPSSPKGKCSYLTPVTVISGTLRIFCTTLSMSKLINELIPPFWFTPTSVYIFHVSKHHLTPSFGNLEHQFLSFLPATGSLSKFEASLCPGPCTAGTGAWRPPVTIGPLPEDALFTWWTPASGHSATRPVQPWLTGGTSRNSPCCRCW